MQTFHRRLDGCFRITRRVLSVGCWAAVLLAGASLAAEGVTDRAVSDAVEDEIILDRFLRAQMVDVASSEGVVTLSGSVDNLLARERIERIAESVKGVRAVVNTIAVLPPILRSDSDIAADVEQALTADPAADADAIDVTVADNSVTLTGKVDSWREKQLVGKVAMGVAGVTDLRNELVFQFTDNRPDSEIRQDVVQTLRWDVLVDDALIDVAVRGGEVVLSGTVGSLAEKRRAIGDAYVANATRVDAEKLTVRRWARDPQLRGDKYGPVSDKDIRAAVLDALFYDPRVASFNVTAAVQDGVVTLRGTVDNLKARRAARVTASNTVGVVRIVDRIKVRPEGIHKDDALKERIEAAFVRNPIIESVDIDVAVRNRAVDLFGSVGTAFEKYLAEDLAARVDGVVSIDNYLRVGSASPSYAYDPYVDDFRIRNDLPIYYGPPLRVVKTDAQLKEDVETELFWSPYINAEDVAVEVRDGKVFLTGAVDSMREFDAATENAYEGGAVFVHNRLVVR